MSLDKILAFVQRDFRIDLSYRFNFALRLAQIIATLVTCFYIAQLFSKNKAVNVSVIGSDYFSFVIIGVAFLDYLIFALNNLSEGIRQEQVTGTLEAVLVSPTGIPILTVGEIMWDLIFNSLIIVVYIALAAAFFGLDVSRINVASSFAILLLSVVSLSGIGMISAAFVIVLKKGNPIAWTVATCATVFGGVYYPVGITPHFMQVASYMLPFTYSLTGLRLAILKGSGFRELAPEMLTLCVFCLILVPLGITLFGYALKRCKASGSLGYY